MSKFASGTIKYRVMVTDNRDGYDSAEPFLWEDDLFDTREEALAAIAEHVGGFDDEIDYTVIKSWSSRNA
jgi:hypothetical protein